MSKFPGIRGKTFKLLDGNEIPLVGLGTYGLWNQKDVNRAVDAALACGYRLFDTANYYQNEVELGVALQTLLPKHGLNRENIFITTKTNICSFNVYQNAKQMIENSLKSLQVDYLDLLLIHYPKDWGQSDKNPKNAKNRMEVYKIFEDYKEAGKVRSLGVSNFERRHIDELWDVAKYRPTVNQCEFHPYLTRQDVVAYCKQKGIFFQAHTSLAKHSKSLYKEPIVTTFAEHRKCTIPQLLLAFAYQQNIGVIPKSGRPERIADNLKLIEVELNEEELAQLSALNQNQQISDCDGWNVL